MKKIVFTYVSEYCASFRIKNSIWPLLREGWDACRSLDAQILFGLKIVRIVGFTFSFFLFFTDFLSLLIIRVISQSLMLDADFHLRFMPNFEANTAMVCHRSLSAAVGSCYCFCSCRYVCSRFPYFHISNAPWRYLQNCSNLPYFCLKFEKLHKRFDYLLRYLTFISRKNVNSSARKHLWWAAIYANDKKRFVWLCGGS